MSFASARPTALIFGVTGQDGHFLSELLLQKGYQVYGAHRRSSRPLGLPSHPNFSPLEADITDPDAVRAAVRLVAGASEGGPPPELYNLAAMSHVATSFTHPVSTAEVDYIGVLNILEAVRGYAPHARFYQASSSEQFGSAYSYLDEYLEHAVFDPQWPDEVVEREGFQSEATPFLPNSPYAVAKVAAHHAVGLYRRSYGLHASCGILFNHETPLRPLAFVTRKITQYVARWAVAWDHNNLLEPLRLGNLDAKRDWGYGGDYVRAMWMMLQQKEPDDYVVATGETHSVREFLEAALNTAGLSSEARAHFYEHQLVVDDAFKRPCEVPYLRGCADRARRVLGWKPEVSFEELVKLMVKSDLAAELYG